MCGNSTTHAICDGSHSDGKAPNSFQVEKDDDTCLEAVVKTAPLSTVMVLSYLRSKGNKYS